MFSSKLFPVAPEVIIGASRSVMLNVTVVATLVPAPSVAVTVKE
jgi:hypothetical protein